MASVLSDSADITSNEIEDGFVKKRKTRNVSEGGLTKKKKIRNDSKGGFIKKRKAEAAVIKDQIDTTQLSSGEYSQARCLSEPKDVFLSHSGKQKEFVRQLYTDLTNQGVSCFFDQDPESLPLAEHFPSRILEAAKTCKVAVLLLSKDFLESKWPMLELSAFVEARDITRTNPNLKILPVFFLISPDALKNTEENDEKWKQLEISREKREEWQQALKAIRPINGFRFGEDDDEVKFREEIVKEIWHILPTPSPRYHVRGMQGEARMCQEVANFISEVQPIKNGIRIAGLYGIAGHGKTTLGKAFCNFKLGDFEGRVCHLEFSRGDPFERTKLALQYLAHPPHSYTQTLTTPDQAKVALSRRVKGKRVMLVLDNIIEESIEEVMSYLEADLGKNSCILLTARSVDVLEKHFKIDKRSCMRVPRLEDEEAITLLLQRAFPVGSKLGPENRGFALKCAKRCLFKEIGCDNVPRARTFHPLALKAFGGYLFSKYDSNLPKWAAEIDRMVDRPSHSLKKVFAVLGKAFDDMPAKYRTIFMLLTVYMLPNMSLDKVIEWMAISCNEEISFIEKAVQDLREKAFIEEFEPEIRIHDLYIEFAQMKANEMERWLWWKEDNQYDPRGLIADDKDGFELTKFERCMYRRISPKYLGNLFVLQLIDVQNIKKLDLSPMERLRSIALHNCKLLASIDGMEKLLDLAWLQIRMVDPMFKLPELSSLEGLQYLEIDIADSKVVDQLGDLTHCFRLREITIHYPSLLDFPRLKGMKHLEKVQFNLCGKVKGPLDCTDCVKLQTIVLNFCCDMVASPLLTGCKNVSELVLSECHALTACPAVDVPSALKTLELSISSEAASAPRNLEFCSGLENLELQNMGKLMELPSFRRLSNLTLLKLGKCGIREPPDLTGCDRLEEVHFVTLTNLERFPNFSSLKQLKKLNLYNCISVQDPPDIEGCHGLQVFYLLYNDNLRGLPKMEKCVQLEEIQVSWHSKHEVVYQGIDTDTCAVDDDQGIDTDSRAVKDDVESFLEHFQDEKFGKVGDVSVPEALEQLQFFRGSKGKTMLLKRFFRGLKLYYSLTAPYCWISKENGQSRDCSKKVIILVMVDGIVMPLPRTARDSQDRDWLNKVREYFAAKNYRAVASASSVSCVECSLQHQPSPRYHIKMWTSTLADVCPCYEMVRICDLEFCGGDAFASNKELSLLYLTQLPKLRLEWVISEDEASFFSSRIVERQKVLLVLNNITDGARCYLKVESGNHNCIHEDSARNFHSQTREEAIAISLEKMSPEELASGAEHRGVRVGGRCFLVEDGGFNDKDPLAVEDVNHRFVTKYLSNLSRSSKSSTHADSIGIQDISDIHDIAFKYCAPDIFSKYHSDLLKWVADIDGVDEVLGGLFWLKISVEDIEEESSCEMRLAEMWKMILNTDYKLSASIDFDRLEMMLEMTWGEIRHSTSVDFRNIRRSFSSSVDFRAEEIINQLRDQGIFF